MIKIMIKTKLSVKVIKMEVIKILRATQLLKPIAQHIKEKHQAEITQIIFMVNQKKKKKLLFR